MPFLRDMVSGAFDLDSRMWRSFRALVTRPGLLTAEYIAGRRRPWLGPLQVFLLANLLFFAVLNSVGGFVAFTIPLHEHTGQPLYGEFVESVLHERGAHDTAEHTEYTRRFDEASPRYASSLVILMVPLFAVVLTLLYGGRRYFLHHLVTSLHFNAFMMILFVTLPLVAMLLYRIAPRVVLLFNSELGLTALLIGSLTPYLAAALRRAHGDGMLASYARGLVGVIALFPILIVYRAALFFVMYLALR